MASVLDGARTVFSQLAGKPTPLRYILISRLLTACGYYVIVPYLVLALTDTYGYRVSDAAFLVGALVLLSRLIALPAGIIVDRVGGPLVLMAATLGSAIAWTIVTLAPADLKVLISAGALIHGTAAAGQLVAFSAVVPRVLPESDWSVGFGLLNTMFNVGAVVGPAIAAPFIVGNSYETLFAIGAAFYFLAGLVLVPLCSRGGPGRVELAKAEIRERRPITARAAAAVFMLHMATWALLQQITIGLAKYYQQFFGAPAMVAAFFAGQAVLVIPLLPIAGSLMRVWTLRRLFLAYGLGTILIPVSFCVFALIPSDQAILATVILIILISASELASVPTSSALVARIAPKGSHGAAFGILGVAAAIGTGAGTAVGGLTLENALGSGWLPGYWVSTSLIFSSVAFAGFILGQLQLKNEPLQVRNDPVRL